MRARITEAVESAVRIVLCLAVSVSSVTVGISIILGHLDQRCAHHELLEHRLRELRAERYMQSAVHRASAPHIYTQRGGITILKEAHHEDH